MHENAELGVCAHWAYKEGGSPITGYAEKMDWLRQVMDWHETSMASKACLTFWPSVSETYLRFNPKGHVLDLASGSTVLDFAYRIHRTGTYLYGRLHQ